MGLGNRIKSSIQNLTNTSKEELSPSQQFANFATGRFQLKTSEFINDLFGDSRNTPHKEMRQGWRMLQNDIQIAQSVSKKNLLIWGREIGVETEDDQTIETFQNEILPKFKAEAIKAGQHAVGLGNGYIEIIRGENTGVPVDFKAINRPHKVYPQYENGDLEITGYVIESFKEKDPNAETFTVMTSERTTKKVTGRRIQAEDIIHLKVGSGAMPGLGRSDFLSAIDDYKILRELKNFQGIAARHKMNPRKAFVFNENDSSSGIDEPGTTAPSEKQKERQQELNNLDHDENPIFHDLELEIKDYDYDPKMPQAQDVLEKLSRDMTSPLPQFLSHASDSNRATSRESKNVLQMELSAQRHVWSSAINPVFQEMAAAQGLDTDVGIKFGDFTFPTRDERTQEVMDLFSNNLLTLGQAVQQIPYDVEVPDELRDRYNFELDDGDNPFDALGQKLDDIGEVDQEKLSETLERLDEGKGK